MNTFCEQEGNKEMENLTELQGTERQVVWAEKIRQPIIARAQKVLDDPIWDDPSTESYKQVAQYAYKWLCAQKKASWWIDHKNASGYSLLSFFAQETKKKWTAEGKGDMFRHPNKFMTGDRPVLFVAGATIY